jgi:hypothetical protein
MAVEEFVMPNLENATPQFLIDELGEVRERIKVLQKYEGLYKAALEARLGDITRMQSERYSLLVKHVDQERLDGDKVKAFLEAQGVLKDYQKVISFKQFMVAKNK